MLTCIICNTFKTRLDNNNLCAECCATHNTVANELDVHNEFLRNLDKSKSLHELCTQDLINIMQALKALLSNKVNEIAIRINQLDTLVKGYGSKLEQLRHDCCNQNNIITHLNREMGTMKQVVLRRQEYLEKCKRNDLRGTLVISGIQNENLKIDGQTYESAPDDSDKTKLTAIMNYIGHDITGDEFELYKIPADADVDIHKVKIKF